MAADPVCWLRFDSSAQRLGSSPRLPVFFCTLGGDKEEGDQPGTAFQPLKRGRGTFVEWDRLPGWLPVCTALSCVCMDSFRMVWVLSEFLWRMCSRLECLLLNHGLVSEGQDSVCTSRQEGQGGQVGECSSNCVCVEGVVGCCTSDLNTLLVGGKLNPMPASGVTTCVCVLLSELLWLPVVRYAAHLL